MAATSTDNGVGRVSNCAAVYHPPLPPDYELDDYWMENIVLKDEKQAEDEFYTALGRQKLNPPPPYVAARIAAAPPYKYDPPLSSLLTKTKQPAFNFSNDNNTAAPAPPHKKKNEEENEKVLALLRAMNHPKRKRSACASGYDCNSLSGSAPAAAQHKKINQKKEIDDVNVGVENHKRKRNNATFNDSDYFPCRESVDQVKKQRLILVIKTQKSSHSCNLSVEHTTSAAAPATPPQRVQNQHQQHIAEVNFPVKSVSPKTISAALPVPAANHEPALPDRELMMIKDLIAAKMGVCGSLMLVLTKTLTHTDIVRGQNRLSIPHRQVQNEFLNREEKALLDREQNKALGCTTMDVELLILDRRHLQQPRLDNGEIKVHGIGFANWKTNSMYVLKTSWISLVQQYQLQEGTRVQLWAFRDKHSKLCFALLHN